MRKDVGPGGRDPVTLYGLLIGLHAIMRLLMRFGPWAYSDVQLIGHSINQSKKCFAKKVDQEMSKAMLKYS